MRTIIVIMLAIMVLSPLLGQAQTVDQIIENNLKARGGVEKINALKTFKINGKMIVRGMEIPMAMWQKKPLKLKMELSMQGNQITMAYDGKTAWRIIPFTGVTEPQEVTGKEADQVKENAEMFDEPFIDYKKKGHKIELLGKEELEGTEVFKLKFTSTSGKEIVYLIDTESFIELKTIVSRKNDDGTDIEVEVVYGDYKEVAGVMFPHSLNSIVNGQSIVNIKFDSIETNIELADEFFAMPKVEKKEPPKTEKEKK